MATTKTTLDKDVTKPQKTAPGDAPHDTTDPTERASTVVPTPGPEALATGVVNGAVPLPALPDQSAPAGDPRIEEYDDLSPDGKTVRVQHNLETGATRVAPSTDTGTTPTQNR